LPYYLAYTNSYCSNKTQLKCLDKFENDYGLINCNNECPNNCFTTEYDYKTSTAKYPTNWFIETFKNVENIDDSSIDNASVSDIYSEGRAILLNIYMDDLRYDHVYDKPSVTADSLLGNLGGQLGK